ncbi:MAG: N-acetylmuramoyl-L-alanine amidase [Prevotella sp.]
MKILIDNGHGSNTPGKRSPDSTFFEWQFNREIAIKVCEVLKKRGYDAQRIVTEDTDVSLGERCRRVNAEVNRLGRKNVLLVSVHANAAGRGNWSTARGFSVFVYTEASVRARNLAQCIYDEAFQRGLKGNRSVPPTHYWEARFYILKHTSCPAVLTESMFYDNCEDLAFLKSEQGKKQIVDLHVEGIVKYIDGYES